MVDLPKSCYSVKITQRRQGKINQDVSKNLRTPIVPQAKINVYDSIITNYWVKMVLEEV